MEEKSQNSVNLNPRVELTIQVRDKNGNIIKEFKKESDPLVRNAIRFLATVTSRTSTALIDEGGSWFTAGAIDFPYGYRETRIYWSYKIAIGMDPTPPTYNDFKLGAKERETTALTISAFSETDSSGTVDIKADFYLDVEKTYYEFGLFGRWDGRVILISRDVIETGVTVPADSYLTIIYRLIIGAG